MNNLKRKDMKNALWTYREVTKLLRRLGRQVAKGTVSAEFAAARVEQLSLRLNGVLNDAEKTLRISKAAFNQGFVRGIRPKTPIPAVSGRKAA